MNWEKLARAETHPLRLEILEAIERSPKPISPNELVEIVGSYVSKVGYHVLELAKAGLIVEAHNRQVRGALEHFYRVAGEGE